MTVLNIDAILANADWPKRTDDHFPIDELDLALAFRAELHPRWPAHTPGRTRTGHPLAGKFMEVPDIPDVASKNVSGWASLGFLAHGSITSVRGREDPTSSARVQFEVVAGAARHLVSVPRASDFSHVVAAIDSVDRGEAPAPRPHAATPDLGGPDKVVSLRDVEDLKHVRIDGVTYRKMPTRRADGRIRLVDERGRSVHYSPDKRVIIAGPKPPPPPPVVRGALGSFPVGTKIELHGEVWTITSKGRGDGRITISINRPDGKRAVSHLSPSRTVKVADGTLPPIVPPPPPPPDVLPEIGSRVAAGTLPVGTWVRVEGISWRVEAHVADTTRLGVVMAGRGLQSKTIPSAQVVEVSVRSPQPDLPPDVRGFIGIRPRSIKDVPIGEKVTLLGGETVTVKSHHGFDPTDTWGVYTDSEGLDATYPHDMPVFPETPPDPDGRVKYLGALPIDTRIELANGEAYTITGTAERGDTETNGMQDWLVPLLDRHGHVEKRTASVGVIVLQPVGKELDALHQRRGGQEVYVNGVLGTVGGGPADMRLIPVRFRQDDGRTVTKNFPRDQRTFLTQPDVGEEGAVGSLPRGAHFIFQSEEFVVVEQALVATRIQSLETERERNIPLQDRVKRIKTPEPPTVEELFGGKSADSFEVGDVVWLNGFAWKITEITPRGVRLSGEPDGSTATRFVGRATRLYETKDETRSTEQLINQARAIAEVGGLRTEEQFRALGSLIRQAIVNEDPEGLEILKARHERYAVQYRALDKRAREIREQQWRMDRGTPAHDRLTAELRQVDHDRRVAAGHRDSANTAMSDAKQRVRRSTSVLDALQKIRPFGTTDAGIAVASSVGSAPSTTNPARANAETAERMTKFLPTDWWQKSRQGGRILITHRAHGQRAYHTGGEVDSTLALNPGQDESTVLHEVTHRMEYQVDALDGLSKTFRLGRSPSETPRQLPRDMYDQGEQAVRDEFLNFYMGKHYYGTSTEIMTMGLQDVFFRYARSVKTDNPNVPGQGGYAPVYDLLTDDPDYADFILGVLAGLPGEGTPRPSVPLPERAEPLSSRRSQARGLRIGKQIKLDPSEKGYWTIDKKEGGEITLRKYVNGAFETRVISAATLVFTKPVRG